VTPLLLAFLAGPAAAYELQGYLWDVSEPIQFAIVADDDGMAERYEQDLIRAWTAWEEADDCLGFEFEYMGIREDLDGGVQLDGVSTVSFGDPEGTLGKGVLSAGGMSLSGEFAFEAEGLYLYYANEVDIVFNNDVEDWFIPSSEIDDCVDQFVMSAYFGRQLGASLGLAYVCETLTCDEDEQAAAMNTGMSACDEYAMTPREDDLAGLRVLYGIGAWIRGGQGLPSVDDQPTAGAIPFERCFEALAWPAGPEGYTWDFDDGATGSGAEVCHVFETPGWHTVTLTAEPVEDGCSEDHIEILACEALADLDAPAFSWSLYDATLTVTSELGLVDVACVEQAIWELWRGDELLGLAHGDGASFELPGPGIYTVIYDLAGPAGELVEEQEVTVRKGCHCSGTGSAGLWLALLGVASLARRRQVVHPLMPSR